MKLHGLVLMLVGLLSLSACMVGPKMEEAMPSGQPVELGATAADEMVHFTVSLRLPGANELDRYLAGLNEPGSPSYRKYLKPAEFGNRFGLSEAEIGHIVEWLEAGGMTATSVPQRTSLAVSGSAAHVRRLLGIDLVDRETAQGARYHVPVGEPIVPDHLRGNVAAISGLNTEPVMEPAIGRIYPTGVPGVGLVPDSVATAYEIDPLHDQGLLGQELAVAIVSFDTFTPSDVDLFDERFGFTDLPPVEVVRLPGARETPGGGTNEAALDIQVIRGIAPQARIINYEGPNVIQGFVPILARIVADGETDIISISWGMCENLATPANIQANQAEFAAAYAAGMSIFAASGDDGAYACRRVRVSEDHFLRDISVGADFPASSPNVIGVGGTFLSVRQDGTYLEEVGWEEPLRGAGGGGGLSRFFDRPDWQVGVGVDNASSNGARQVPDVAGPADPASGFHVVFTDPSGNLVSGAIGGTSAAAPFWAASMVLAQQLARSEGIETLGNLGPTLYQIAAEQPTGAVFHDIVRGGNLLHQAGPGWDYSTGLGSPRVAPLARAIVDYLSR